VAGCAKGESNCAVNEACQDNPNLPEGWECIAMWSPVPPDETTADCQSFHTGFYPVDLFWTFDDYNQAEFLDQHHVVCPHNMALNRFVLETNDRPNVKQFVRYQFTCCLMPKTAEVGFKTVD
jgi:hypothetical protein